MCMSSSLSIYLYLSIYESNHIRLSLSIQAYIPIYLSIVVTMYPHLPTYLSIHPSIHPSPQIYLSVCVPIFPHPPIYLTLTPMRLCMSVYPFINISSCLSMYHSTMYLCTHPLPIYLCIRPSIQTQTQQSISVCLSHLSTYPSIHTNVPILLCVSVYPYLSVSPHAPIRR